MENNNAPCTPETQGQNFNRPMPPKTWLMESILVTLFCCLPFGIVGIINASKVESLFYAGNADEAFRLSQEAKKWTMIGFWIGLGVALLYILFLVLAALTGIGLGSGLLLL